MCGNGDGVCQTNLGLGSSGSAVLGHHPGGKESLGDPDRGQVSIAALGRTAGAGCPTDVIIFMTSVGLVEARTGGGSPPAPPAGSVWIKCSSGPPGGPCSDTSLVMRNYADVDVLVTKRLMTASAK